MTYKIGDEIIIDKMSGEPEYTGIQGTITNIDDFGQLHGTWGAYAVIPEVDEFRKVGEDDCFYV